MGRHLFLVALCALSTLASAAAPQSVPAPRARLELVTAVSSRSGAFEDGALPVRFGGVALGSLRLSGALFPWGPTWGVSADLGLETFRIRGLDASGREIEQRLGGFHLVPSANGRWAVTERVGVEALFGYGLGAFPVAKGTEGVVSPAAIGFSGPQLGGAVTWALPTTLTTGSAKLRGFVMPFALTKHSGLDPKRVGALGLGAQVALGAFAIDRYRGAVVLDYELTGTRAALDDGDVRFASLVAHRFGIGVRGVLPGNDYPVTAPPTGPGRLLGSIVLEDTQRPALGAQLAIDGRDPVSVAAGGTFTLRDVGPGEVTVRATLAGYTPLETRVTIPPEDEVELALVLRRPTGPGRVRGVVRLRLGGDKTAPASELVVEVAGGPSVTTDLEGAFTLEGVGPGPVAVTIQAKGYKKLEEVALVPPGGEAQLELALERLAAEALASMRGKVRSARGPAVQATLLVPEAKIKTKTKKDGTFFVRLPGGRYTVVFQADGFVTQTKVVEVDGGDQALFYVDLSPMDR